MATNSYLGFSEDGTELFEMKSKMARQIGNDVSASVKAAIRSTLGVPASAEGLTPANNLSDVASAATSRTNLDVYSTGETDERTNASDASSTVLQSYEANSSNKWSLRGDGRIYGTHELMSSAGKGCFAVKTTLLANDGTLTLSSLLPSAFGLWFVTTTNAFGTGIIALRGATSAPVVVSDPFSQWSTTATTASKFNIYDNSGPELENKSGVQQTITFVGLAHYQA